MDFAKINYLLQEGYSLMQIAELFGVNYKTFHSRIYSAGYRLIIKTTKRLAPMENIQPIAELTEEEKKCLELSLSKR